MCSPSLVIIKHNKKLSYIVVFVVVFHLRLPIMLLHHLHLLFPDLLPKILLQQGNIALAMPRKLSSSSSLTPLTSLSYSQQHNQPLSEKTLQCSWLSKQHPLELNSLQIRGRLCKIVILILNIFPSNLP